MLKLGEDRHELQYPGGCDCGEVRCKSYPTVRLGAPVKLKNLNSKIGRRVDLARVRYGTMQSESMRAKFSAARPVFFEQYSSTYTVLLGKNKVYMYSQWTLSSFSFDDGSILPTSG